MIKNDLSNSLNRFNKNFSLIMTSSKSEYKAFLNYNYGYSKNNIILTGMSRFDFLTRFKCIRKNKIAIIPTIRETINETNIFKHNQSIYSYKFNLTNFFEFYDNLINDQKLLLIMKENNYQGFLCLPSSFKSLRNFHQNKVFSVIKKCDYKELLFEASLFVIDYSNIFLDLGYIKKPIIYAHFDYEEYRLINHQIELFNYNKDGFGPICKDLECTVSEIISHITNKCLLKKKFRKRIEKFITFTDGKNNDRIFFKITKKIKTITPENEFNLINIFLLFFLVILLYKYYIYIKEKFFISN